MKVPRVCKICGLEQAPPPPWGPAGDRPTFLATGLCWRTYADTFVTVCRLRGEARELEALRAIAEAAAAVLRFVDASTPDGCPADERAAIEALRSSLARRVS